MKKDKLPELRKLQDDDKQAFRIYLATIKIRDSHGNIKNPRDLTSLSELLDTYILVCYDFELQLFWFEKSDKSQHNVLLLIFEKIKISENCVML